jgi:hypothetical protein
VKPYTLVDEYQCFYPTDGDGRILRNTDTLYQTTRRQIPQNCNIEFVFRLLWYYSDSFSKFQDDILRELNRSSLLSSPSLCVRKLYQRSVKVKGFIESDEKRLDDFVNGNNTEDIIACFEAKYNNYPKGFESG